MTRYLGPREVLLASAFQATADSGTDFDLTVTVNEPGTIDLARVAAYVANDAALANGSMDLLPINTVTDLSINGSSLLIRGRGTNPGVPGQAFSGLRANGFFAFPQVHVTTGDTISATFLYTYAGGAASASLSIPFLPDRFKGGGQDYPIPHRNEVALGAPITTAATATAQAISLTFDTPGIIDLKRLVIGMGLPPTLNIEASQGVDFTPLAGVRQILLRSDYNMVVGNGTAPTAAASMFAGQRQRHWIDLGRHKVTPGDILAVTVFQVSGVTAQCSFSVPLWPTEGGAGGVAVGGRPC